MKRRQVVPAIRPEPKPNAVLEPKPNTSLSSKPNASLEPKPNAGPVSKKNDTERAKLSKNLNTKKTIKIPLQRTTERENDAKNKTHFPPRRFDNTTTNNRNDKENENKELNGDGDFIGEVPGVEVGDEFQNWEQLNTVHLHRPIARGINHTTNPKGKSIATSVVFFYDDISSIMNYDSLFLYSGEGGNVINQENADDDEEDDEKKLEEENNSLKNSFRDTTKPPIRVIIRFSWKKLYRYYGLYEVEAVSLKTGNSIKFSLKRKSGQKEIFCNGFWDCKINRRVVVAEDISYGKERIPIQVIHKKYSNERVKFPFFMYRGEMVYPKWCKPLTRIPRCDCYGRSCLNSEKCSCAKKNGGEIPFDKNKALVEPKGIVVYECGPRCKCSLGKCHNRVSQFGIKYELEIFRTRKKGWGVRSRDTIPAGGFVCEYTGKIIRDDEAVKRFGNNDEYFFNIGNNALIAEDENRGSNGRFTIDASQYGNVARFINHSCLPNLYGQNVLYDHDDVRIPHIMLFAAKEIPKMQELCYDYGYKIDQVIDPNGNVKKKDCFCGAEECTGRLY